MLDADDCEKTASSDGTAACAVSRAVAGSRFLRIELTVQDEAAAIRHMRTLIELMSPPPRSGSCGNNGGWSTSDRSGSSMATWEYTVNTPDNPPR
jgi:hypothetical protein